MEDMDVVIKAFARAAGLAREGGFDGVEIDMCPESLLGQFLSPLTNHRQDEYGGHHATATVELLADQGKEVHMVTSDLFIGFYRD